MVVDVLLREEEEEEEAIDVEDGESDNEVGERERS